MPYRCAAWTFEPVDLQDACIAASIACATPSGFSWTACDASERKSDVKKTERRTRWPHFGTTETDAMTRPCDASHIASRDCKEL